jgi:hypothetical protein
VRSTGVGRARISDVPGLLSNRPDNSLRLLTEAVPENRILASRSCFEFSGSFKATGKPVIASPHLPVAGTPKQEKGASS